MSSYKRGHVVALRRDGGGVVWRADDTHVWVSPVGGCNGCPRHRAEIRVEESEDAQAMGLKLKYPVIRCQTLLKVKIDRLATANPIGVTPPMLLARVIASVMKEATTLAAEERMMHMRDVKPSAAVL